MPHWHLHVMRSQIIEFLDDGWRVAAKFPYSDSELNDLDSTRKDCWQALSCIAQNDTTFNISYHLNIARLKAAHGHLASAVNHITEGFSIPRTPGGKLGIRLFKHIEPDSSGEAERRDPAWQDVGSRRKYNAKRAKFLSFCLQLLRKVLASVLSNEHVQATDTHGDDGVLPLGIHEDSTTSAAAAVAVRDLSNRRHPDWSVLHEMIGLCIAVTRDFVRPHIGTNHFWEAFHEGVVVATKGVFIDLIHAGKNRQRPYLCWTLLAQLRCFSGLPQKGELMLSELWLAAATQIHTYVRNTLEENASLAICADWQTKFEAPTSVESADAFFQILMPYMPVLVGPWGSSADDWSELTETGRLETTVVSGSVVD